MATKLSSPFTQIENSTTEIYPGTILLQNKWKYTSEISRKQKI